MIIGLDIDDVLYKTSNMIRKKVPPLLRSMNLPDKLNEDAYVLSKMYGVSDETVNRINLQLDWISHEFINTQAVHALKHLKKTNPDIEYNIVTWRVFKDAEPIAQLIRDYMYLDIHAIHCVTGDKAAFCENAGIDILLDDSELAISGFTPDMKSKGVLVSTSDITHNKRFAERYHTVLTDWQDLHNVVMDLAEAN